MKKDEVAELIADLRESLPPGSTVYTILRHVSRSGMLREIGLTYFADGRDFHPNYAAAKLTGSRLNKHGDGVRVHGCGMDMGFHLVYSLSERLYCDGFGCIGAGCPSNDHSNGDRDYTPHKDESERRGADGELCGCHRTHWHRDGGYALRQRWL